MTAGPAPFDALAAFADRIGADWWIGSTPPGNALARARAIAGQLGYPSARTTDSDHDPVAMLIPIDRAGAAHVLAVAAGSLAYGRCRPEPAAYTFAVSALALLGDDATFLANGLWSDGSTNQWIPLSTATFDAGVIGWDATHAFILWVEDED